MLVLAWASGLLLATHFFGEWQARRDHPNAGTRSVHGDGYVELRLDANRQGHYLLDGEIDGHGVTFLLDTGASQVAIPEGVAERLGLPRGTPVTLRTANGLANGYATRLASLRLGDIHLDDVAALVAPGMPGDEVLLGMSALRRMEFSQRDGTLVLRHSQPSEVIP